MVVPTLAVVVVVMVGAAQGEVAGKTATLVMEVAA